MKAFIAVLLVASVAATPLSLLNREQLFKLQQEKELFNGKLGKIGGIRGLPLTTVRDMEIERVNLPIVERMGERVNNVYTIEELYTTELFREYMQIPLFREYLQYPVFQQYVASPLFQQFWGKIQFQQYFRNPVLFYKYIYPQIQALKETQVYTNEYVRPIARDNVDVLDYFRGIQGLNKNRFVDVERRAFPLVSEYPTQRFYGEQRFDINNVNYKYLLEKIVKDLLLTKTPVTEIVTDVKVMPKKELNFDNIKIVDGQIVRVPEVFPRIVKDELVKEELKEKMIKDELVKEELIKDDLYKNTLNKDLIKDDLVKDTLFKDDLIKDTLYKDAILKKMYLNKIFGKKVFGDKIFGDKIFADDMYMNTKTMPLNQEYEIIRRNSPAGMFKINGEQEMMYPTMYEQMYNTKYGKNMLNKNIFLNKFLEGEKMITPTVYNRDLFTYTQQPKEFLTTLGQDKMYNTMYNTMLNKDAKDLYYTEIPKTFEQDKPMMYNYNTMPLSTFETLNKEIKY